MGHKMLHYTGLMSAASYQKYKKCKNLIKKFQICKLKSIYSN